MAHLDWSSTADSDPKQSVVTRRELFSRFADTPTLVIGGHFSAGHIKRDGERSGSWRSRIRRVGKAKRAHHSTLRPGDRWWARRKGAFAHPTLRFRQLNFPPRCSKKRVEVYHQKSQKTPQGVTK